MRLHSGRFRLRVGTGAGVRTSEVRGQWGGELPIACPMRVSFAGCHGGRALIFHSRGGRGFHRRKQWGVGRSRPW